MAGEGPFGSHGPVEALDLAVGLGSIRPGPLVGQVQLGADLAPQLRAITATVVGQDAFNAHSAGGEPCHGALEHTDGGQGCFIVVDLGVGHPAVVVDDGVAESVSKQLVTVAAAFGARSVLAVLAVLSASDVSPAATDGDVSQLLDVDA